MRSLSQGIEAEISLVLDVLLPAARVVDALKAFRAEFPTGSLRRHIEALGAARQMVQNGGAAIGIAGPLDEAIVGIERVAVGTVEMISVAAPLVLAGRNVPDARRDHIQLVLTDRSELARGQDLGVIGTQTSAGG